MQRAGAEKPVRRPGAELLAETLELDEHAPHLGDRVDPEIGPRSVGGKARGLDLEPGEPAVGDAQLEPGRLGQNAAVDRDLPGQGLRTKACELLVGDGRDQDVAAKAGGSEANPRAHRRGQPGLHVEGATAVEAAGFDPRLMGGAHAGDAHGVGVGEQHQCSAAAGPGGPPDHVRASGRDIGRLDREPT